MLIEQSRKLDGETETMASVATKLMSAEEFCDWVHQPENRDRYFELERGEIIEMPPPTHLHGFVCGNLAGILRDYALRRKRGYTCTNDSGVILDRNPDTVRGIDVAFYDGLPTAEAMQVKYAVTPPILAAEVLSSSDRPARTTRRVGEMFARGVQMVWLVDPELREVSILRPGELPATVDERQELDGGEVLPGFHCRVAEFFGVFGE
jgi:Uma2 family endonuclease